MVSKKIRRVTRVGRRSHCVVIPSAMIEELGWKDRQEVLVTFSRRKRCVTISMPEPEEIS